MAREGPIIICGADISALGLANGLLKHGIAFQVYEADPSLDSRGQGYRIRVHGGGGEVLQDLLSPETWKLFLESCGKLNGMASLSAQEARELPSPFPPGARGPGNSATPLITPGLADHKQLGPYVVDRSVLRHILFRKVESHVTFGKRVDRVEGVTAHFTDGTSVEGARLIVGCDGAKSRLRMMAVPSIKLYDTKSRYMCVEA